MQKKTPKDLGDFSTSPDEDDFMARVYREGANNRNKRRAAHKARAAHIEPCVPARPETIAREMAKMQAILDGEV